MFLVNPRYQMGPHELMLDGTLPRFVNLPSTLTQPRQAQLESPHVHFFIARPVRAFRSRRASRDRRAPRRRRCRRCGRGALDVAVGRRARRRGRCSRSAPRATTSACACSSAAARRWCRPTISPATSRRSPSARSRWRRSRPRTSSPALPILRMLATAFPDLDLLDPELPSVAVLEERALRAEAAGLAVKGVTKSEGASASAEHRRHGAGDQRRLPRRLSRLPLRLQHVGDRRRRHRDGDRLRLHQRAARRRSRIAGEGRAHRRRARGGAAQSAQGRDHQGAGRLRPAGGGLAGRASRQRDQRQLRSRARPASSRTSAASGCSAPASASSTIRCASAGSARGRSTARASPASGSR